MRSKDERLLPCPFCGKEQTDIGFIPHENDCYLMLNYMRASKRQLLYAWNTRKYPKVDLDKMTKERER